MVESPDFLDPLHGIPVFSLYGRTRRPDRRHDEHLRRSAGRPAGRRLPHLHLHHDAALRTRRSRAARQGGVGARSSEPGRPTGRGSCDCATAGRASSAPGRCRCVTVSRLGELGHWFVDTLRLDVDYDVIPMSGWQPEAAPGFGWPVDERTWVNPSPNAANLSMARCYAGTVMLEGTTLSEGRGTTRPLELFGAPDIDARALRTTMYETGAALAAGLSSARMLVRADVPQTRRQTVLRHCRSTSTTRTTTTRHFDRGA